MAIAIVRTRSTLTFQDSPKPQCDISGSPVKADAITGKDVEFEECVVGDSGSGEGERRSR